jgi:hypothetical protein
MGDRERNLRESRIAACGVTPQAQNTGMSPAAMTGGSPKSGEPRSLDADLGGFADVDRGTVDGGEAVGDAHRLGDLGGRESGRMDTTMSPLRSDRPGRTRSRCGTSARSARPPDGGSGCRRSVRPDSKVKEQPMRKDTRSGMPLPHLGGIGDLVG